MFVSSTTVNDVFDEAATRLNEVSADEAPYYLTWINLCTRDIAFSFPNAPFNYVSADRTLSAATRHYTNLPSDFEKMIDITYPANGTKLKYLAEEEFDAIAPSASQTGNPTVYTIHGAATTANSQVEFYPIPGSGLTVNYKYRKLPATVSASSATVPIPSKYIELYNLFLEKQGLRRREDYGQADAVEAKYEMLKEKMKEDFKRMTEEPWRIRSEREILAANTDYNNELDSMQWSKN